MEATALDSVALVETVAARLCHDLSGLMGTLIGTLELAEEEGDGTEALAVSSEAARELGGRLRLLRAAWGGVAGGRDAADMAELLSHAAGFPRSRTDWSAAGSGQFDAAISRLLLNLAMVGLESLPRGGTVRLAAAPGAGMTVALDGTGARWPEPWVEAVRRGGAITMPESRQVGMALTLEFARADRIALSWREADGTGPAVLVVRP